MAYAKEAWLIQPTSGWEISQPESSTLSLMPSTTSSAGLLVDRQPNLTLLQSPLHANAEMLNL